MLIKLDDAIALLSGMGTSHDSHAGERFANALRALPTVSVSEEMVEVAARAMCWQDAKTSGDCEKVCLANSKCLGNPVAFMRDAKTALEAALGATVSDGWEDIATLPDNLPIGTNALFWGVAHVSGSWLEDEQHYQRWITEQKIFKWAYVGRDHGRGPNGSANLENWYEPSSNVACRVEKLEATKWRPLPAPPSE